MSNGQSQGSKGPNLLGPILFVVMLVVVLGIALLNKYMPQLVPDVLWGLFFIVMIALFIVFRRRNR